MARRVTSDSATTGAAIIDGDLFDLVKTNNTTDAGTGSNMKVTAAELAVAMQTRVQAGGAATGPLSALVLANSPVTAGFYGDATHVPRIAVNAKGIVTSVANISIGAAAGTINWINVRASPYNAAADGVTDDRAAIQAAIDVATALPNGEGGAVYMPQGIYAVGNTVFCRNKVRLIGDNRLASMIRAKAGVFPINTPVVSIGESGGTGLVSGSRLENIGVDANNIAGSIGVFSDQANELCGLHYSWVGGARDATVRLNGAGISAGGGSSSCVIADTDIGVGSATSTTTGIHLNHTDGQIMIRSVTVNGSPFGNPGIAGYTDGVLSFSCHSYMDSIHIEHCVNGLHWTSGTGVAINVVGGPVTTNVIRSATVALVCLDIAQNGATHTIIDDTYGNSVDGDIAYWNQYLTMTNGVQYGNSPTPAAPAAGAAVYSQFNGGLGKYQLLARFPTGASIVIATQP